MRKFLALFAALNLLLACNKKTDNTTESTGLPGEVLIITDESQDLETFTNLGFRDSLLIDADIIPKTVYESGLSFWKSEFYDGNDKLAHLVIVPCEDNANNEFTTDLVNPTSKNNEFEIYENVWAKPQVVVKLNFEDDLKSAWIRNSTAIISEINKREISFGLRGFFAANGRSSEYTQLIKSKLGVNFTIPPQFIPQQSDSAILWFIQDTRNFYQHILLSKISKAEFPNSIETAEKQRNEFINTHIKNVEKTKILVSISPHFKKDFQEITIAGKKASIMQGWYSEESTFRRGIFYRYYFPHGEEYIIMDAFAFAPSMPKSRFKSLFGIIANSFAE